MWLAQVSLALLNLVQHFQNYTDPNVASQVVGLSDIITKADIEKRIDTIAYFGNINENEPYLFVKRKIPRVIITQSFSNGLSFHNDAKLNSNIFFIAVGELNNPVERQYLYAAFGYIQSYVRGVFVTATETGLHEHFEWCWRKGFAYVLILVKYAEPRRPFKIYSYSPFPKLRVIQLPTSASPLTALKTSYFNDKFVDFHGYKLRTAVQYDPPRVFSAPTKRWDWNATYISGYAARIYNEFLKYHNGQLCIVRQQNILSVIEALNNSELDFSMNPYLSYPGVLTSYPLIMMRWCILVPAKGEIYAYEYFLRPFRLELWSVCLVLLLYLSFVCGLNEFVYARVSKLKPRGFHVGRAFIEVLRLMLYLPAPQFHINFRVHYAFNYMFIAVLGFILANTYLALLTSYLTKVVLKPQVNSLSEIVAQNLTIHAVEHEIPLVLRNRGLPKGFMGLFVPRKASDLVVEVLSLNVSAAYMTREDLLSFTLEQERNQLRPRFRMADECITTLPVGFLMPSHSQFKLVFDMFMLRAASAGLLDRWFQVSIWDGFRARILQLRSAPQHIPLPLSLDHFQFAYLILCGGAVLAFAIFALEQLGRFELRIVLLTQK